MWVAPAASDAVSTLLEHMPVERVLFGSDWPHAEGLADPKQYLEHLADALAEEQSRIMRDNARELTFP